MPFAQILISKTCKTSGSELALHQGSRRSSANTMLLDRRAALAAGLALALPSPQSDVLTLSQSIHLVQTSCDPTFIAAVASTGAFLYRGEDLEGSIARRCTPKPDLLDAGTYDDAAALRYFEALEQRLMTSKAAPSTGHIGVASMDAASEWGRAASIWPLGQLHYAWPRDRAAFWPRGAEALSVREERLGIDVGLADALHLGRELLFASEASASAYVAIDARADDEVRRRLRLGSQSSRK